MKKDYTESRKKEISYIQYQEGRLIGLVTSCVGTAFKKGVIEGKTAGTRRRGRRHKQLLDDLREKRKYWNLKEEALNCTRWKTCFGRGYRPVARENEK
jgi:hypothetical protein